MESLPFELEHEVSGSLTLEHKVFGRFELQLQASTKRARTLALKLQACMESLEAWHSSSKRGRSEYGVSCSLFLEEFVFLMTTYSKIMPINSVK